VAWGKTAEVAENYLQKGSKIALEGRLVHRTYETKEGEKKYFTEVVANSLMMLDPKTAKNSTIFELYRNFEGMVLGHPFFVIP